MAYRKETEYKKLNFYIPFTSVRGILFNYKMFNTFELNFF